ncbi:MAG: AAA family ATPase [Elusimicrobia bacterium]|nr:AAA family ATPase [Elusimicrobiota bacterium]
MIIVGLTGLNCSGKDTVADYMVEHESFTHYSLSDEIRKAMKRDGIETSRENLISYGTNLRSTHGNGVLAKMVMENFQENKKYCVTSIRHPDEVEVFRKSGKSFLLVNVQAPREVRFERMKKRARTGDPDTLEKFIELENKESQTSGSGQRLVQTVALADITFENNFQTLDELYAAIKKLISGSFINNYE